MSSKEAIYDFNPFIKDGNDRDDNSDGNINKKGNFKEDSKNTKNIAKKLTKYIITKKE